MPEDDVFDGLEERTRNMHKELAAAPVVNIRGVVISGVGGGQSPGESDWEVFFSFGAWQIDDGDVHNTEMTVRQRMALAEMEELERRIKKYQVWKIRAGVVLDYPAGKAQALAAEIIGPDSTNEILNGKAKRLQEPVTLNDARLGTFLLDRSVDSYSGSVEWNGKPVRITFPVDEPEQIPSILETVNTLKSNAAEWSQRLSEFAISRLLPWKNEDWLEDDENELTESEFLSQLQLTGIMVWPGGKFDFMHKDGGMFGGHAIVVDGNLSDGFAGADLQG